MDHSKDFVYAGNWAYSNLGCEAIVRGTTCLLREAVGESRFFSHYFTELKCTDAQRETDPAIIHRPFPYFERYSLSWIQSQIERRFLRSPVSAQVLNQIRPSLKEARALFILGGDTFTPDYGNSEVYFALSNFVVDQKVPVTLWGASIGPFSKDPGYEQWAMSQLRRITLLCVRETETLAYLTDKGVKDNVILSADPSFYLQPSRCELHPAVEKALQSGCIGLNLSPLLYRYLPHEASSSSPQNLFDRWIEVAADLIKVVLRRLSQPVLLIPHVFSECGDPGRDDYLFMRKVAGRIGEPEGVLVLEPGLNAAQTKWVISRTHAFAGARTHSTLAAISTGVPTICIGYSAKAKGIAKDVYGHLDWLIRGQDLAEDPTVLSDRLVSIIGQHATLQSHLRQIEPGFKQRVSVSVKQFLDIVR